MGTRIEAIGEWAAGLRYEDIPERIVRKTKVQVLNMLAAAMAGTRSESAGTVGRFIAGRARRKESSGSSTVFPLGFKTSAEDAVFANAAYSMSFDFDDYLVMGHTGHSSIWVPLALAEARGASGRDALTAIVVGNEVAGRLGASALLGPHNGQTWSFIHAGGAAASAAKLMGLTARQTAEAVAISLYQPPFVLIPGFMGPGSKLLTAAQPAANGMRAAALAAEGMTGPRTLFDSPRGFLRHFSYVPLPGMLSGWGKSWVTDSLAFKIYPGCAYIDTTVDALLMAREQWRDRHGKDLEPGEIEEVHVAASRLTTTMDQLSRLDEQGGDGISSVTVNFSIPLSAAVTLLHGRLTSAELTRTALHRDDSALRSLASRVRLTHSWKMTHATQRAINTTLDLPGALAGVGLRRLVAAMRRISVNTGGGLELGPGELGNFLRETTLSDHALNLRLLGRILFGGGRESFSLDGVDFDRLRWPFGAKVEIRSRSGERVEAEQTIPWGAPGQPDADRLVEAKWRREAAGLLPLPQIASVVGAVASMDRLPRLGPILPEVTARRPVRSRASPRPAAARPTRSRAS